MTRDAWADLRGANPIPAPAGYPDDEIAANVAAIVAAPLDLGPAGPTPSPSPSTPPNRARSSRRWLVPALAAGAVVAVAATTSALLLTGGDDHPDPPGGTAQVACRIGTGATPTKAELARARAVISVRAHALGSTRETFTDDGATIRFTPHGITASVAARACTVAPVAMRPLIMNAVPAGDPDRSVPTALPRNEAEFAALNASRQAAVRTAVAHLPCRSTDEPARAPVVLCGTQQGRPVKYLLGAAVISGPEVASARAQAPNPNGLWSVELTFGRAGSARLAAYTRAHSSADGTVAGSSLTCTSSTRPCANFLAMTFGGVVRFASENQSAIPAGTAMQVTGRFSKAVATKLAADFEAAALRLRLASAGH